MSQEFAPPATKLFQRLWQAQGGNCALCGKPMPSTRFTVAHATVWKKQRPTFDHIHALARGGQDDESNLQLAHAVCNKRKGRG